jgi:hypothetical protein
MKTQDQQLPMNMGVETENNGTSKLNAATNSERHKRKKRSHNPATHVTKHPLKRQCTTDYTCMSSEAAYNEGIRNNNNTNNKKKIRICCLIFSC